MSDLRKPIPLAHKRAVGALLPLAGRRDAIEALAEAWLDSESETAAKTATDPETPEDTE